MSTLEHMFGTRLPEPDSLGGLDDAALIDAMTGWAAAVAAADARRLAVMAEFTTRRMGSSECAEWMVDDFDAASIEVGAALNLSAGVAGGQMDLAMTLRTRLPRIAAQYAAGAVNARTISTVARRTDLVQDPGALAALDSALADRVASFGPLSQKRLEAAIDVWVTAVDPHAVRRTRRNARDREVIIGSPDDQDGITTVWARLMATDAKILDARLTAMANGVCVADPRTVAQRRSDALGALGAGSNHLACACNAPACPAGASDGRAASVVIHVVATSETLEATPDSLCHGDDRPDPDEPPEPRPGERSGATPVHDNPAAASAPTRAAVIVGGSIVPAPLLAELIANGAKVRPVAAPGADAQSHYRPSTVLDTWVRLRDLTCRAPGCDRPAVDADVDHTVPWPAGPTHPSNTKCYCRFHHLAKTFWPGFTDRQNPDGTVEFSTPTGHTYMTHPFAATLFPAWDITTAVLPTPSPQPGPDPQRTFRMPRRKRTRAQAREYRINTERALNAASDEPPPF